jgi:acyl dehydratase
MATVALCATLPQPMPIRLAARVELWTAMVKPGEEACVKAWLAAGRASLRLRWQVERDRLFPGFEGKPVGAGGSRQCAAPTLHEIWQA